MNKSLAKMLVIGLVVALGACGKSSSTDGDTSTNPSNGTGSGGTFTATDIAKAWTSGCNAQTDSVTGATYYKNYLTLNTDGSFFFQQYLHTENTCSNAYYIAVFTLYGTYSVGAVTSGTTQAITFTVTTTGGTAPDMMLIDNATHTPSISSMETAFNNDCGATSPFCNYNSGTSSCSNITYTSGSHEATKSMNCMSGYTFPNTGTNTVYNVGTYANSVLTLGAGVIATPGTFSSGSRPSTATVTYN